MISKVGINLLPYKEEAGGIVTYVSNLLLEFGKSFPEVQFYLFTRNKVIPPFQFSFPNFCYIRLPVSLKSITKRVLFEQTLFNFYLKKEKVNVLFNPGVSGPLCWNGKQVTTIHDCAYNRFPEESLTLFHRIYYKIIFPLVIKKATYIITVSNFSKNELINFYNLEPNKIKVIYEGVPSLPQLDKIAIENIFKNFNLNYPYFLFVGNQQPRKNIIRLVKAFKLFAQQEKNFLLVFAGNRDEKRVELYIQKELRELADKIVFVGVVSREELVVLYKKSIALVFPSLYEGFGLPVLEAQSLGVPVLTSNVASLPEVAGKGALFVNPYSVEEIANGMQKIASDDALREKLIQEGYRNVKRFSWEKAARELINVFEEVYYEKNSSNK